MALGANTCGGQRPGVRTLVSSARRTQSSRAVHDSQSAVLFASAAHVDPIHAISSSTGTAGAGASAPHASVLKKESR